MTVLCACISVWWVEFTLWFCIMWLTNKISLFVHWVWVGYVIFVVCKYAFMFCAFPGPLSQWDVCLSVFSASFYSLSGAPASLLPSSSLGCDCSQLTPPAALATQVQPGERSAGCLRPVPALSFPPSVVVRERPLLARILTKGTRNGFRLSCLDNPWDFPLY